MQKASSPAAMNAQKSYRAALERAFASGTLGELAKTLSNKGGEEAPRANAPPGRRLLPRRPPPRHPPPKMSRRPRCRRPPRRPRAIRPARTAEAPGADQGGGGRDACTRAVDAYVSKYEKLPDDYEVLTKALAHKGDERVRATLMQLTRMLGSDKPRRARTLAAQLRFLEDTHGRSRDPHGGGRGEGERL